MQVAYVDIGDFSTESFMAEHSPFVAADIASDPVLKKEVLEWGCFTENNRNKLPVFQVKQADAELLMDLSEGYYKLMQDALVELFDDPVKMSQLFKPADIEEDVMQAFIAYAKHTYQRSTYSLYGRLDIQFDPSKRGTKNFAGVYEFNADTPTMLLESSALQDTIATKAGHRFSQENGWYEMAMQSLQALTEIKGRKVAVVCHVSFAEDYTTTEHLYWMFEQAGFDVNFETIDTLQRDDRPDMPFHSQASPDIRYGVIFMLLPWEEMIISSPDLILNWTQWSDNVMFLEPPWRWFMSNKQFLSVLHDYVTRNPGHIGEELVIPTYRTEDNTLSHYVSKPCLGRFSSNIQVVKDNVVLEKTPGLYGEGSYIHQEYRPPTEIPERGSKYIACVWYQNGQAATLAFREFDDNILELNNERFVSHQIV